MKDGLVKVYDIIYKHCLESPTTACLELALSGSIVKPLCIRINKLIICYCVLIYTYFHLLDHSTYDGIPFLWTVIIQFCKMNMPFIRMGCQPQPTNQKFHEHLNYTHILI